VVLPRARRRDEGAPRDRAVGVAVRLVQPAHALRMGGQRPGEHGRPRRADACGSRSSVTVDTRPFAGSGAASSKPMSRRQRKKEPARRANAPPPSSAPAPPRSKPPWEEALLGPDGYVDRLLRLGVPHHRVLALLAAAAVRMMRKSPVPDLLLRVFFA